MSTADRAFSAYLAMSGAIFTAVLTLFSLRSFIAFPSLRRCAQNKVILYLTLSELVMSGNILFAAVTVLMHNGQPLPHPSTQCTVNGILMQVTAADKASMFLFYMSMLIMFKKGNRSAAAMTTLLLTLNFFLFLGMALLGAFMWGGYVPSLLWCWVDATRTWEVAVFLYGWAAIASTAGIATILYLLYLSV